MSNEQLSDEGLFSEARVARQKEITRTLGDSMSKEDRELILGAVLNIEQHPIGFPHKNDAKKAMLLGALDISCLEQALHNNAGSPGHKDADTWWPIEDDIENNRSCYDFSIVAADFSSDIPYIRRSAITPEFIAERLTCQKPSEMIENFLRGYEEAMELEKRHNYEPAISDQEKEQLRALGARLDEPGIEKLLAEYISYSHNPAVAAIGQRKLDAMNAAEQESNPAATVSGSISSSGTVLPGQLHHMAHSY